MGTSYLIRIMKCWIASSSIRVKLINIPLSIFKYNKIYIIKVQTIYRIYKFIKTRNNNNNNKNKNKNKIVYFVKTRTN